MKHLIEKIQTFALKQTGESMPFVVFAPGRVNLIGEHTDYNDGFVLPCAIDYGTVVAARLRSDQQVTATALDYAEQTVCFDLQAPLERDQNAPWSDYVKGVFSVLLDLNYPLNGLDIFIAGDVPQGAGLSSSASLQVAMTLMLNETAQLGLTAVQLAQFSQRAENDFVGCQCGIMDQLASAAGRVGHALLIDCRDLSIEAVQIPSGTEIVIVNSNVRRGLVESEYNTRRQECERAALALNLPALRDADDSDLKTLALTVDDRVFRRARHVVTENARTLASCDHLRAGALDQLSRLMAESHRSLRDDFEVTVEQIDILVDCIDTIIGERGGVRMTGGGFGGCVVALVPKDLVDDVKSGVLDAYQKATELDPSIYVCRASSGAHVVDSPTGSNHTKGYHDA